MLACDCVTPDACIQLQTISPRMPAVFPLLASNETLVAVSACFPGQRSAGHTADWWLTDHLTCCDIQADVWVLGLCDGSFDGATKWRLSRVMWGAKRPVGGTEAPLPFACTRKEPSSGSGFFYTRSQSCIAGIRDAWAGVRIVSFPHHMLKLALTPGWGASGLPPVGLLQDWTP